MGSSAGTVIGGAAQMIGSKGTRSYILLRAWRHNDKYPARFLPKGGTRLWTALLPPEPIGAQARGTCGTLILLASGAVQPMPHAWRRETIDLVSSSSSSASLCSSGSERSVEAWQPHRRPSLQQPRSEAERAGERPLPAYRGADASPVSGADESESEAEEEAARIGANSKDLVLTLASRTRTTVLPAVEVAAALRASPVWLRVLRLEPVPLMDFAEVVREMLEGRGDARTHLTGRDRLALRAWLECRGVCVYTDE